jgi:hypothetical protein
MLLTCVREILDVRTYILCFCTGDVLDERTSFVFAQAGSVMSASTVNSCLLVQMICRVFNVLHWRDQLILHPTASSHLVLCPLHWLQQSNALLLAEPDANSCYASGATWKGSPRALHIALYQFCLADTILCSSCAETRGCNGSAVRGY